MRSGDIPKEKIYELGVIVAVWLNPVVGREDYQCDHQALFEIHRKATAQAMHHQPDIDWLLENQDRFLGNFLQFSLNRT